MAEEVVVLVHFKAKPAIEEKLRGSLIVDHARTAHTVDRD